MERSSHHPLLLKAYSATSFNHQVRCRRSRSSFVISAVFADGLAARSTIPLSLAGYRTHVLECVGLYSHRVSRDICRPRCHTILFGACLSSRSRFEFRVSRASFDLLHDCRDLHALLCSGRLATSATGSSVLSAVTVT